MIFQAIIIESGRSIYTLNTLQINRISSINISPDGKQLISISYSCDEEDHDYYLNVWDLDSRRCTHTFIVDSMHNGNFTPDSKKIVIRRNNNYEIWDINSGLCTQTFETHNGSIGQISITPNGKQVVSYGGDDKTIKFWDIADGSCIKTFRGFLLNGTCFDITSCGKWFFAISSERWENSWDAGGVSFIQMWDIKSGICCKTLWKTNGGTVRLFHKVPDSKEVIFLFNDGSSFSQIIVLNIETGMNISYKDWTNVEEIIPGQKQIIKTEGELIYIYDLTSNKYLKTFKAYNDHVCMLCIAPDGKKIFSSNKDGIVKIWDMQSGDCLKIFKIDSSFFRINETGEYIFSENNDENINVWDVDTGEKVYTVTKPSKDALAVIYKGDKLIGIR